LEWLTWTAAGVIIALGLGVVNLWFGVIRPWRQEGHARLEVRLENHPSMSTLPHTERDWRLVIENHGPADAYDVDLPGFDAGPSSNMVVIGRLPVPRLLPGQQHHMWLSIPVDVEHPEHLKLSWRDRRGAHSGDVWVSPHVLF
jgi:hypothetical protein